VKSMERGPKAGSKAWKVLKNYLKENSISSPTRTIYSLLGLSLQPNGEVKELTKPDEPVDLSSFRLIIIDEASMINSFLFDVILCEREGTTWNWNTASSTADVKTRNLTFTEKNRPDFGPIFSKWEARNSTHN